MNARLMKETRELLPVFIGTLLLIVVPYLIWHLEAEPFGAFALGLGCAVLGGCAFGNEFQHRTVWLLLSQPIARSVIWRDKMLVLAGGMVASLSVLAVCHRAYCPAPDLTALVMLPLIALCAFCGAPYWTLRLRHGIGGMVFAAAAPGSILGFTALAAEWLSVDIKVGIGAGIVLIILYCAVVYWRGYASFQRLQAVDGPSRELSLPAGLEAVFTRPLARVSSRFRGPFATLLQKELRLQQISLLLLGLFTLVAVVGFCLIKRYPGLAEGIVGGDYMIYVLVLPLIAGATSLAEEKGWGIAEWHLTLPPSALKQWSAKMLATLSTSLTLGLLLPSALFLAGAALLGELGTGGKLPSAREIWQICGQICGWVVGQLLLTSVAIYAASVSKSTLRAILAAFALSATGFGVFFLTPTWMLKSLRRPAAAYYIPREDLVLPVLCAGLFLMLCLTQWLAWSNFRRSGPSVRRVVVQLLAILCAIALVSLAILAVLLLVQTSGMR